MSRHLSLLNFCKGTTIRTIPKIAVYSLVVIFSFIFTCFAVIQTKWVQTFAVKMVADYLSRETRATIRIGGFDLSLRRGLVLEDLQVKDLQQQEILFAHKFAVVIRHLKISKKKIEFGKVFIDSASIQLIIHKGDSVLSLKRIIDRFTSTDTTAPVTSSTPWKIKINIVELARTQFHFFNENIPQRDKGMVFTNIRTKNINLLITDFIPEGDTMNATIKRLSVDEESGFSIHSMSGEFRVSPAFLKAKNFKLITNNSKINMDFEFRYKSWAAYNDFLNKVTIVADIHPTTLAMEDIGPFAPVLYTMKDKFGFSGNIHGTVANFKAKNFRVAFGKATKFFGNISANGLPEVEETFVDMNIKSLSTSIADIESFRLPGDTTRLKLPAMIESAGKINLKGNFTGFYNDFVAQASLVSDLGELNTDLLLRKQKGASPMQYKGSLNVHGFDIGKLLSATGFLGKVTLTAEVNGQGIQFKDANLTLNARIDSLNLKNYTYCHINVKGTLIEKKFDGHLDVSDPNLNLVFNGGVDYSDSIPVFDFSADIRQAKLFALHLLSRDSVISFSTRMKVDFTGNSIDNIDGTVKLENAFYQEGLHYLQFDHIELFTSTDDKKNKSYRLKSDFADADISGDFSFSNLLPSVVTFIENYVASFRMNKKLAAHKSPKNQVLTCKVDFRNTDEITSIFLPFLKIAPNTQVTCNYNEQEEILTLNGHSPDITCYGIHLVNWSLNATANTDNLMVKTGCDQLVMGKPDKKDSLTINIDSVKLQSEISRDTIRYALGWSSKNNPSLLSGFVSFSQSPLIALKVNRFNVFVDHKYWELATDNYIIFDSACIAIHDFALTSGKQLMRIDGRFSDIPSDTLTFTFNQFDISDADHLIGSNTIDIDGLINGTARLSKPKGSLTVLADLRIDQFRFNKEVLGDANFNILYDNRKNRFDIKSLVYYTGNMGTTTPLAIDGKILMGGKEPVMDFSITMKNLNLKMVGPFVRSFMSDVHGLASGDITLKGTLSKPKLSGQINLMRTEFRITYLNILYSLADVVTIDSNAFHFRKITLFDSLGNKAYLNGEITHRSFKDLALNLNVDFTDFSAFRNTYQQNQIFYGQARASGSVSITGPIDNLVINVKARTGTSTQVSIPINLTAGVGQNDFIIFDTHDKDTLIPNPALIRVPAKGLSLFLSLLVNPNAMINVFLPDQLGSIRASGKGNISMSMTPTNGFSLIGTYVIDKGTFGFALKNLMSYTFNIREGSQIAWTGDVADANLRISATYRTRVSLAGIVTSTELSSKRVPVECVVYLSGKLSNPDISFSLNLPNVEDQVKSQIYAAIDTNNQAELSQQVLSILAINQFKSTTGTPATVNVSSAPLTIVTNQLGSWLSKVTHNVNVGVNYKAATASAGQEFDVDLSTQLLNDRLLIDGTFGMSSEKAGSQQQQASNIVGDINIEYILTNNRIWRARAFNRTNTIDNPTLNNAPYTQGVGLSWQRDFNRVSGLFKTDKKKKSKVK